MANFGNFLNTAGEMVDAAGRKTAELVDKAKINMDIAAREKELAATFEGIGRLLFDAAQTGENVDYIRDDAFETVRQLQNEIEKLRAKLYAYQGMTTCRQCGAVNEMDAIYCKKCGKTV